jgi:hypothetical protein
MILKDAISIPTLPCRGLPLQASQVTLIDFQKLRGFCTAGDLPGLLANVAEGRSALGFRPAEAIIGLMVVKPDSAGQRQRMDHMQRLGIYVQAVSYWLADRRPSPQDQDGPHRPIPSLLPQLCTWIGAIAKSPSAELLVVTPDFGVCEPLLRFVAGPPARKAGVAWFPWQIDRRWDYLSREQRRALPVVALRDYRSPAPSAHRTALWGQDPGSCGGLASL